jgi:hypothetical protein
MPSGTTLDICGDLPPSGWTTTVVKSGFCAKIGLATYIGRTIRKAGAAAIVKSTSTTRNDSQTDVKLRRVTKIDVDGDGKGDPLVFNAGVWSWINSTTGKAETVTFGASSDKAIAADFDGDSRTDFAIFQPNPNDPKRGQFQIMDANTRRVHVEEFGSSRDIPLVADWDGDGRADLTVFTPGVPDAEHATFLFHLSGENVDGSVILQWKAGDMAALGDYDGDGRTDACLFRPTTGVWLIKRSSDSQLQTVNFGSSNDIPVVADYDRDGHDDVAVFRNGTWLINGSTIGVRVINVGLPSDIPVPADYDGDGWIDIAFYREGNWFWVNRSNDQSNVRSLGMASEKPLLSIFPK